jgi:hypothetical protein
MCLVAELATLGLVREVVGYFNVVVKVFLVVHSGLWMNKTVVVLLNQVFPLGQLVVPELWDLEKRPQSLEHLQFQLAKSH